MMTYEEMLNVIESRIIFPFSLSWKARKDLWYFYNKYSTELIGECISIGARYYLRYDADGLPTQESVCVFLNKLGGILHNKTRSPIQQSINYIQAIGQKTHEEWSKYIAKDLMNDYIEILSLNNWNETMIVEELREIVIDITKESKDWMEWQKRMEEKIKKAGGE